MCIESSLPQQEIRSSQNLEHLSSWGQKMHPRCRGRYILRLFQFIHLPAKEGSRESDDDTFHTPEKNRPSKKDGRSSSPSIPKQCGSAKLAFLVSRFGWTVHNPTFWGLNFEPTISTSPPTRKDVMKIYVLGLPTKIQSKTPNTSWFLSAEICKSLRDVSVNHLPPRSINESSHGWSLQWTRISNTKKSLKSCIGFTFRTNSRVLNTFSTEGSIQNQQGGPLLVINGVITEPLSMAL